MPDKCHYPAFMEASILLPQPVSVTGDAPGAPLSRSDQVRQAARARNTQRAYLGHWTRFHSWAQEQGLDLPGGLEAALCDYLVRLAEDGKRMATIRQARAAIIKGADLAGWPKPGGPGVAEMMRELGRILRGPRDRRRPSTPRPWRRSGPPPSPAAAPGLCFTQNPGKVMDDITFVRSYWWLVSEGFSLSTANSDVQKLPATQYHRMADSLACAA